VGSLLPRFGMQICITSSLLLPRMNLPERRLECLERWAPPSVKRDDLAVDYRLVGLQQQARRRRSTRATPSNVEDLTMRSLTLMKRILGTGTLALIAAVSGSIPAQAAAGGRPAVSSASESVSPIVGRWQQLHTCQELVDALNALGLGALAPGMVGDYFPDQTFDELAAKYDLCEGAKPQQHSHFFTASGLFGSLDQFGNQVDDGTYVNVDSNTIQITKEFGVTTFDYSIQGGILQLTPIITDKQRRDALRQPEGFLAAGWMVSMSYPGSKWTNVPCAGWC